MSKITRKSKSSSAKPNVAPSLPLRPATVVSAAATPEVATKSSRISLEFLQPGAKRVCVAGSFNDWKPEASPLTPRGDGHWSGNLTVKPGRHEYLFVVDGQWLPDPKAKESVSNPFGGHNSVLLVAE